MLVLEEFLFQRFGLDAQSSRFGRSHYRSFLLLLLPPGCAQSMPWLLLDLKVPVDIGHSLVSFYSFGVLISAI